MEQSNLPLKDMKLLFIQFVRITRKISRYSWSYYERLVDETCLRLVCTIGN